MKQLKPLVLTTLLTVFAISSALYSSCRKDRCAGVVCDNGGRCSNSGCVCPTGYSGNNCEYSSIIYQNNTYTPVSITVNGTNATIPVGSAVSFSGTSGNQANCTASTYGTYGLVYSWSFSDNFPSNGNGLTEPFDISADYFFLEITNVDPFNIVTLYVNYGLAAQTVENVSIPSDGNTYNIGYYHAYSNTRISVDFSDGAIMTTSPIYIPNTIDAAYNLSVN